MNARPIIAISFLFLVVLTACQSNEKEKTSKETVAGYELMQQKCFICHMEKPDPEKRGSMLAPPMVKVQEHYKPSYPDKQDFIDVITAWVLNPSEDKSLMPGAVRRFKLMPRLPYEEKNIRRIAAALYDMEFATIPNMHKGMQRQPVLNKGKKWKLREETLQRVARIQKQLETFSAKDIAAYRQLGRDVFNSAKTVLMDTSYKDTLFTQIHAFFNGIEGNMHLLIAAGSLDEARRQQEALRKKFSEFDRYFE